MLLVVVACLAFTSSVSAGSFTDMNCTNGDATTPKFLPTATVCEDKYTTAACASLFGTAVVPEGTTDRDAKCLTDEDVKQIAIDNCPKSCGYCCLAKEYTCKNAEFPRVKCETVTAAQCKDPTWRPILAEDCPSVCGLCLEGGCVDTVIECENDPTICRNVDMQDFVKVNCKKTCGYCTSSSTLAPGGTTAINGGSCPNAVDSSSRTRKNSLDKLNELQTAPSPIFWAQCDYESCDHSAIRISAGEQQVELFRKAMLHVVVICFALASSVSAAFTDMNCTNGDSTTPTFLPSATACDNKYADGACAALFGTAVVAGGTTDRDALCLTDADVKEIAIDSCAKHCGYCCLTPEYKCDNVDFPRVRCETITPAQCRDPTWRTIIAEDCPNVCGFCLEGESNSFTDLYSAFLYFLIVIFVSTDIFRLRTFQFIPSATACDNKYADGACATLFGTAVVAGGTTDRDAKCLTDADVKEIAIDNCAKHCGYCCMTDEYRCKNKD
ncbi:hypothetical protein GCK32_001288, partial [Trichostrongylus colubriformis]